MVIQFCGDVLTNLSGELHAPGSVNGDLYDHNMDCGWIIQVEQDARIELKIFDIDIEESESCRYDFLQVHNMSYDIRFPTMRYLRPAKSQISLHIRTD